MLPPERLTVRDCSHSTYLPTYLQIYHSVHARLWGYTVTSR